VSMVLVYALFFASVAIVAAVTLDWAMERRSRHRTIRGMEATAGQFPGRQQQLALPVGGRVLAPMLERFGRLSRRLSPAEAYERIERELVLAGSPAGWDAERVFAFKLVVPVITGGGALTLLLLVAQVPVFFVVVATIIAGAAGWYAPEWILRARSGQRQKEMQLWLADSLDLMSITVEAGLAFDAALTRVARNVRGPLGEELYRVVQEMQLGKSRGAALRDLADRTSVADLRSFIAAMVQADAFGIPIAKVLKVQAREIRIRRRQRAEEQAQKLPVKIVFPVVLTIFPALFVVLLGPAAIQIYETLILGL
jgi:tight adherence protein C